MRRNLPPRPRYHAALPEQLAPARPVPGHVTRCIRIRPVRASAANLHLPPKDIMRRLAPCWLALLLAGCDDAVPSRQTPPQSPPPVVAAAPGVAAEDSAPPTIAQADTASVPVQIGGEEGFDACGAAGKILPPKDGSAFVELRRGPGRRYAVTDRLRAGDQVVLCDGSEDDGGWSGVLIYDGTDCGDLGPSIAERQPYRGSCKSGWIPDASIEVTAG